MFETKELTIFLYDKDDVTEFNKLKTSEIKKIFVFSPGIEKYIKNYSNYEILKIDSDELVVNQKNIINTSKKIYFNFENNINNTEYFDQGLKENIYNIFFISLFSFLYIHYNSIHAKYYALIYNNKIQFYDNKVDFLEVFIEKIINKKNQGFFEFLKSAKVSFYKKVIITLNNYLIPNNYINSLVYGKKLSLKILEKKEKKIIQVISCKDFNIHHLLLNFLEKLKILNKQKHFYFSCFPDEKVETKNVTQQINLILEGLFDDNLLYLKKYLENLISNYCILQVKIEKNFYKFISKIKIKKFYTDQLRYDLPTVVANNSKKLNFETFLVPHGSMSTPSDEYSSFVNKISGRGMLFSPLADKIFAQTRISAEAISFYDDINKVIKSEPLLFGDKYTNLKGANSKKNYLNFLHVSSPKSLSKWPWIYEDFNEYINNLNNLIIFFSNQDKYKLTIRFRDGPECDLKTFKKITNNKSENINFSKNKSFIDDLSTHDVLISYSSTAIEEFLIYNKPVLIYSDYKNYKHINYKFRNDEIIYSSKKTIRDDINSLSLNKKINYDIKW